MKKRIAFLVLIALVAAMTLLAGAALAEGADHDNHFAYCSNPGVCAVGGEPYTGDNIRHGYDDTYVYDGEYHWRSCACGELTFSRAKHAGKCTEPDVCRVCGAPYAGEDVQHSASRTYQYDENTHWEVCQDCGAVVGQATEHRASCTYPGECVTCGSAYTGSNVSHGRTHREHDETNHWSICDACGQVSSAPSGHRALCTEPGMCYICGASYAGSDMHHWNTYIAHDNVGHWELCADCGQLVGGPGAHYTDEAHPGQCAVCGVPMFSILPSTLTGDIVGGTSITATVNSANAYAYNFWLFDSTGTIVQSKTNTFDTSWTFSITTPGVYLVRTYATNFADEGYADTAWFAVDGVGVNIRSVTVSGEQKVGSTLTGVVNVNSACAYNFWLFDSNGAIVQSKTNTFDTSWSFTVDTAGVYLLRVYATDFDTEAVSDSAWFFVEPLPVTITRVRLQPTTVQVGQTIACQAVTTGAPLLYSYWVYDSSGAIVMFTEASPDNTAAFTIYKPGSYLIRAYATDLYTEAYCDSAWFTVVERDGVYALEAEDADMTFEDWADMEETVDAESAEAEEAVENDVFEEAEEPVEDAGFAETVDAEEVLTDAEWVDEEPGADEEYGVEEEPAQELPAEEPIEEME